MLIIVNIPSSFHATDLRSFFSAFVETSRFELFHFLHRKEEHKPISNIQMSQINQEESKKDVACCAFVKLKNEEQDFSYFHKLYSGKEWIDQKGNTYNSTCRIMVAKDETFLKKQQPETKQISKYLTNREKKLQNHSNSQPKSNSFDFSDFLEFHPPAGLPNGNVGTPTELILEAVEKCIIPTSLLKRLGIKKKL